LADGRQLLTSVGRTLHAGGAVLRGVMTHAGSSYSLHNQASFEAMAEQERSGIVAAAAALRAAGLPCPEVSVGSTPTAHPGDFVALSGYINVQGIVYAIKQCGDDLTRENLLKQATSLKGQRYKMMLPGVLLNTTPQDYAPYESLRMAKFEGSSWKLIDEAGTSASAK
jgi:hypothetical protein